MKRIAILVIADTSLPVYIHYIESYWTELIHHTRNIPHIDVFLLFEDETDLSGLSHLRENVIQDICRQPEMRLSAESRRSGIPGILRKTIYAFELLQDRYDVYFRTNLSSVIRLPLFDHFVQAKSRFCYSGCGVWKDALRDALVEQNRIGPDKSIRSLTELEEYPGNTFISGSGFFLNAEEVRSLVQRKHRIRYDIIDDVAIGLMMVEHQWLPGFSVTVSPQESVNEIKKRIRHSDAAHVRLVHFPVEKARRLWEHMKYGQLWQVVREKKKPGGEYKMYFPLFDHIESRSNEVRLIHEGLLAHDQVVLVDDPESADYLIFCQNHIVDHCPFHERFRPLKDKFKHKSIMLDFGDDPNTIYDADDFAWTLYFKQSCVDRRSNRAVDYGDLPVVPTAYCVVDEMAATPLLYDRSRPIAVSCLFDDSVLASRVFVRGRGRLLKFARTLRARHNFPMQIGTVSECGPVGRSAIDERYKKCLYESKIVLHANPDPWEGDARTWEAVASGALVFIDRMCQPISHPLVDGEHVIFYDLTDEGLEMLEEQIIYYLSDDEERERIGRQGRDFVLSRHRSIDRVEEIFLELETQRADVEELKALVKLKREAARQTLESRKEAEARPSTLAEWQDPVILHLTDQL